ncbi:DUF1758 domain-containing protein [Trichonephila clavipes]|nr:DUF1758 domain-containing protein [Trichonephila clavipes]
MRVFFHFDLKSPANKQTHHEEHLRQLALEIISFIPENAVQVCANSSDTEAAVHYNILVAGPPHTMKPEFLFCLKKIETELIKENIDMNQLSILKTQFMDKFERLDTCQNQISEQLLDTEDVVQEYLDDMEDAENYRDRYIEMCTLEIDLKKFSGEAKDFLAFWSRFQKIHNHKSIAEEDKMQYLLQSVEPKSKAERLVLSFPATAENYPKANDQLKERFGREDLLRQIYVHELLNLVMKNAVSGRTETDLSALYDELEGKLRSLESLG